MRMPFIASFLLVGVVTTLTADSPIKNIGTRKHGVDWPNFLGKSHDNKSSETGSLKAWPQSGPPIVWQKKLGIGYGGPSISKGRLFIFDRHTNTARLTCMKSETGEELWRFEYPTDYEDMYGYNNGPRATPVVEEDRVYLLGAEGMLRCVKFGDTKELWKVDTTKKYNVKQNFFGVGSTPVIEKNLLIVMVGGSPKGTPEIQSGAVPGNGTGIVAFDKLTGKVVYEISDELASYASPSLATIDDRRWCFVFARGGLVGFEPKSGKVDFHYPWRAKMLESVNAANPIVVGDNVFISETYAIGSSLLKVRPGGYDVVWKDGRGRDQSMKTHWNTPIHVDGHVYGSSGRHTSQAELRCIELKTGKVKWSQPRLTRSSLLYVDGHFICLTEYGQLALLRVNPEKFDLVSDVYLKDSNGTPLLGYPAWAAPVLSHGLLYVRGKDRLVCLDLLPTPTSPSKKASSSPPKK